MKNFKVKFQTDSTFDKKILSILPKSLIIKIPDSSDPRPQIHPSKQIDHLVNDSIAPLMKLNGYKKSGLYFYKSNDKVIRVLNFQKSQWNDSWESLFYVNIGLYWIDFQKYRKRVYEGKFPKSYDFTVGTRIDDSTGWKINLKTNFEKLQCRLLKKINEDAIPWLDKGGELNNMKSYFKQCYQSPEFFKEFRKYYNF